MTRKPVLSDSCAAALGSVGVSLFAGFDFPTTVLAATTSGVAVGIAFEVGRTAYELANRNSVWLLKLRRGQCPLCEEFSMQEVTSEPGERRLICGECTRSYALRIDEKTGIRADYLGRGIPLVRRD